jgi:formate-dependent nitrite reductase cytochrome c552 subunit
MPDGDLKIIAGQEIRDHVAEFTVIIDHQELSVLICFVHSKRAESCVDCHRPSMPKHVQRQRLDS